MKSLTNVPALEEKDYGPNCSEEELHALKSWVYLYNNDVMILKPAPKTNAFVVRVFDEQMREISTNLKSFDLILDLTSKHERPSAEIRDYIRQQLISFGKVRRVKAVTGANWLANIAAQFIFNSHGLPSLTVHKTLEQALEALESDVRT